MKVLPENSIYHTLRLIREAGSQHNGVRNVARDAAVRVGCTMKSSPLCKLTQRRGTQIQILSPERAIHSLIFSLVTDRKSCRIELGSRRWQASSHDLCHLESALSKKATVSQTGLIDI
jgi:hypothetical protein